MPLIIDESDATIDAFPQARALRLRRRVEQELQGRLQVAAQRRALRALERRGRIEPAFMSGEDLTAQPGLALQQDLALAGLLGLIACRAQRPSLRRRLRGAARERARAAGVPRRASGPVRGSTATSARGDTRGPNRHRFARRSRLRVGRVARRRLADATARRRSPREATLARDTVTHEGARPLRYRTRRHHHERRHRPHGHQPASGALDQRDSRAGRRRRWRTAGASCPTRSSSAATQTRSKRWRERTASRAGRPISTRRSPTATTRSTSIRRRPGCAPQLIRQAIAAGKHIYTEKPVAPTRRRCAGPLSARRARGRASTASCRTSCGCPACSSCGC